MKQHFTMLAAYNRWANNCLYDVAAMTTPDEFASNAGVAFKSLMGTLNHILVLDRTWMKRFTGEGDSSVAADTILYAEFAQLRRARESEDQRIIDWLARLSPQAIAGRFTYMNGADMRTVSQRLAPALAHFFNHQAHHRGQAHAVLTALGHPSAVLDLSAFLRSVEGRQFA